MWYIYIYIIYAAEIKTHVRSLQLGVMSLAWFVLSPEKDDYSMFYKFHSTRYPAHVGFVINR